MQSTLFDDFDEEPGQDEPADEFGDEAGDEPPARIEIHGRLFMRSGGGLYTNIEDADDDRIFAFDPETGELTQWPDHD